MEKIELLKKWDLRQLITIFISKVFYGDTALGKNKCIKKIIEPILEKYKNQRFDNTPTNEICKVWMLWWQGEEQMPEMIKLCYNSIVRCFEDEAEVILLTEDNIYNYVSLPQYIEEKRIKGQITLTHYSDIVRFHLLNKFGGIWIDATYFAFGKIDKKIFNSGLYTIVNPHPNEKKNNDYIWYDWAGNWIKLPENSILGQFIEESFLYYWKNYDYLIEYYFIDHLIRIAYDEIDGVKEAVLECGYNNISTHSLLPLLNVKADMTAFNELVEDTTFFKLSTKVNLEKEDEEGYKTLYALLLNNQVVERGKYNNGKGI